MDAIELQLQHWFVAFSAHPERFSLPVCDYLQHISPTFPSISNGTYPKQISDPRFFSLLVDIRYAFLWHLHCDQVLTMTNGPGHQQFNTFLQQGEAGITTATYLGAAIPGCFCPNYGFHFKPHNDEWSTESNPIEHFTAKSLLSLKACDYYEPVTIKVHGNCWAPIPSFLTRDQLLTQRHHANTPRQSCAHSPTQLGKAAPQPQAALAYAQPCVPDPILDNPPGPDNGPFDQFAGQPQVWTPQVAHGGVPPLALLPGLNQPFILRKSSLSLLLLLAVHTKYGPW